MAILNFPGYVDVSRGRYHELTAFKKFGYTTATTVEALD